MPSVPPARPRSRRFRPTPLGGLLLLLLSACGGRTDDRAPPIDGAAPAQRIVSLTCTASMTLEALDALDRVVAVEEDCPVHGPDGVLRIRNDDHPGKLAPINLESILALHPDAVVARPDLRQALDGKGLRVLWSPAYTTLQNLPGFVRDLGALIGASDRAERILTGMEAEEAALRAKTAGLPRTKTYLERSGLGWTYGSNNIVDDMITLAGGTNIAGAVDKSSVRLTQEAIFAADPDVIILGPFADPKEEVLKRPGWKDLRAVREGRFYQVPFDHQEVTLGCPQCIEACKTYFLPWLHPELGSEAGPH